MDTGRHVIKGLKAGAVLRLLAQAFTWINTLILIRLLTEDDYGLMAMTMAFIGIFALMGDLGMGKTLIQAESLSPLKLRQAFTLNLISGLTFFCLFYFSAPVIAIFFNEPQVTFLIQVAALQFLILIFHTLPSASASREMLFKEREKVQFWATLMTSVLTLAMAAAGLGVWSLICGHLFMRLALTIGFNKISPCWAWPTLNFHQLSSLSTFGGITTTNDLLRYFFHIFGNLSIGRLLSKTELGIFSVARNLANLPSDKIGELVNHIGLSSLAKLQNDRGFAGLYLQKSIQLAGLILFPVYFGLCAIAPDFIPLMLTDKWTSVVVPFQILCLSSPFRLLTELLSTGVTAIGKPGLNSRALFYTLMTLPVFIGGIQFGVEGACWAWLGITLFSFACHLRLILPEFKVRTLTILACLFPGFSCSAVMLAGLLWGRSEITQSWSALASMFTIGSAGLLIFISMQVVLFRTFFFKTLLWLRH
ncbi:lipopolysaccharide biosynthesis protein [Endozoicomonas ascidiicola]|uniref:lipopolysaccharide biosynthesis protein n=1 Tax=Endozoicomonas ascidiicola TaxID=1698521 RepID=UPI000833DBED|nr:lipopolysaccharide biosynthesis protein [Endozoicomonas ascidiicola]